MKIKRTNQNLTFKMSYHKTPSLKILGPNLLKNLRVHSEDLAEASEGTISILKGVQIKKHKEICCYAYKPTIINKILKKFPRIRLFLSEFMLTANPQKYGFSKSPVDDVDKHVLLRSLIQQAKADLYTKIEADEVYKKI